MSQHLPRFRVAHPLAVGEVVTLADEELHHARVRRLAIGESVALFDGAGFSCVGIVDAAARDAVRVRVIELQPPRSNESPLALTLAVGLPKGDKLDWVVEKATELGVTALQPFASAHTLGAASAARRARWEQIALAAAKQCGRSVVPTIHAPLAFEALLTVPAELRLLLAERGDAQPLAVVGVDARPASLLVAVGAEGGFSDAELGAAHAAGFALVTLGARMLRAETAAIVAAALCQARWGDL
ncbi:MAG: 16S rRNA (uracil(1498)-N(3))-methyltransferase [bacterium]